MRQRLRRSARPTRAAALASRIFCLLSFALAALTPASLSAEDAHHFSHQAWTTEDGLPQNSVHQILQTRDGYLWIATESGLARFDGLSFTVFRHEDQPAFLSDDIACLAEDRQGALWIGTTDGLVRFQNGEFTAISLGNTSLPTSVLGLAGANDGSVLVSTVSSLTRIIDGRASPLPQSPTAIDSLTQGPDNTAWIAAGTRLLEDTAGHLVDRGDLSSIQPVLGLEIDPGGAAWLRSPSGLATLTLTSGNDHHAGSLQHLANLPPLINTFLHDDLGELWIGTKRGLFLASAPASKPVQIDTIGDRSVLSITRDREGNLWVGTEADGLHILRSQKVSQIGALNDHALTALAQAIDGSIWIGTRDDGLRLERPAPSTGSLPASSAPQITRPQLSSPLTSQVVLALAAGRQNDVWVGTLDGLAHITRNHVDQFSSADGLPDDVIRSLLVDDDRSLWIGTRRGLVHWAGTPGAPFERINHLPSDLIGAMLRGQRSLFGSSSQHPLWVATLNGLSSIDRNDGRHTGHRIDYGPVPEISGSSIVENHPFPYTAEQAVITSLAEDPSGTLWIGTRSHGLAVMTDVGLIRSLPPASGLPLNINSLLADGRGHLWLGTPRGIFRVATDDLQRCLTASECSPPVARIGYADGMPTEETTAIGHPAALLAADGTLWFATAKGIATLNPATMHETAVAPPVVLQRFLVDNAAQPQTSQPLQLPFGHNSFTFDYAGLSFAAPSRVRYRYLLSGFDKQWTEAGTRRTAYYTNLPPGRYVFRVQAANSDGLWNRTGAELAFTIRPPFYRRAWFYLLVALALASLAYAIYYLRVRRLRSEFDAVLAERSRIAREIHDTLAQNFVGISIQLQIAEQHLAANNTAGITDQLQQTRALVQEGLNDARQSIWELRASVAQDSLPTRISRAVERSKRNGIADRVTIGGIYRPLDASVEKEVLRIAQEALANVSRHAHATEVHVELRYESNHLLLSVVDNGTGFDPDAVSSTGDHFGLEGMRERAAGLAATLSITSAPRDGTTLRLMVPLPRTERRTP